MFRVYSCLYSSGAPKCLQKYDANPRRKSGKRMSHPATTFQQPLFSRNRWLTLASMCKCMRKWDHSPPSRSFKNRYLIISPYLSLHLINYISIHLPYPSPQRFSPRRFRHRVGSTRDHRNASHASHASHAHLAAIFRRVLVPAALRQAADTFAFLGPWGIAMHSGGLGG